MFPPDTSTILLGESITLTVKAMPVDSLSVVWTEIDGNTTLNGLEQTLTPTDTISYAISVNNYGCIFKDTVTIVVEKPSFDMPNAFTPNGDGANDAFGPVIEGYTFVQLEIWSRWGEKVFDSLNAGSNTWDGTINGLPAPSDVYIYRVNVLMPNEQAETRSGDVTLLR
jgi:gliding motility-associated-like protein